MVRKITLPDERVCVLEDTGNSASEEVVVFLPGALGSLQTDFAPQFEEKSPFMKYRLICFEPAGYGRSRPPNRTWTGLNNFKILNNLIFLHDFLAFIPVYINRMKTRVAKTPTL